MKIVQGQIVDIHNRKIFPGEVRFADGKIVAIAPLKEAPERFVLPGFIDAHVHIESSMLVPAEFARLAVRHGTVATVSDPHEIANVLGLEGVYFMLESGKTVPFKFFFGAPSCVPATTFESAGATIDPEGIEELLRNPDIWYLAEMMNFPGVIHNDPDVHTKIDLAHKYGKPVDGHAPGLRGEAIQKYQAAGISTDHECFTQEEALEKLQLGMKILIREGSAAKNFAALIPLLPQFPSSIMFCSDDKHPDDLLEGHINLLVARALAKGYDLFEVLRAACLNPVMHYDLPVGLLRESDPADFIVVHNLEDFRVEETYVNGELVATKGKSLFVPPTSPSPNQFYCQPKEPHDFARKGSGENLRVILALDGELITEEAIVPARIENQFLQPDLENDILKITVVNRYEDQVPAVAFIKNFGLKEGAIASCVGHDSHNIIAVGTNDADLARAVNLIIRNQGGISAVSTQTEKVLPLPVAGIMSDRPGEEVGKAYGELDQMAKEMGSQLRAPFMTLSFMALLVIPQLKLSDKGLFDGHEFRFTPVSF
jgi:adenine deaminase